jgi:hypothetical protein
VGKLVKQHLRLRPDHLPILSETFVQLLAGLKLIDLPHRVV